MLSGDNGLLKRAGDARDDTVVGQEKEQVELAYISAAVKKLGTDVTDEDLQIELNASVGNNKTKVTTNSNNTLNVLFKDTQHNYNVNNGQVAKVDVDDTNDGIYIGEKKILSKLYVPTKDEIIGDYIVKFGVGGRSSRIANSLANLATVSGNGDYLDVLKDLGYISQDYANFVKSEFLDKITNQEEEEAHLTTSGAPMFEIQKKSENKYNLVLGWHYMFEKQGTTLYKNTALITSEITFLNNDFTEYELGNLKLENSDYECNTTNAAPFGDDLSKYTNSNNEIENFLLVYNGKKYEGTSGLKQFLDNIIGLKNKEIASRYIDVATYVNDKLNNNYDSEEGRGLATKYGPIPVKNTSIVSNYVRNSNNLDGIYIKGERVTSKINSYSSIYEEENLIEQYYSLLFSEWQNGYIRDFKAFEYFLNKQLIDPTVLNIMLKGANAYPNGSVIVRNVGPSVLGVEQSYEPGYNYDIHIPYTYSITIYNSNGSEIMNVTTDRSMKSQIKIGTNDEVTFSDFEFESYMLSLTLFGNNPEGKFEWDDFRKNGLLSFASENILPYPDKQEFWTIANEYASKDDDVSYALSIYNNGKTKNHEIDLYVYVYRSILKEAIQNGNYELKQNGKTYTGKDAIKNCLIENYGLDKADKVREMAYEEEEEEG